MKLNMKQTILVGFAFLAISTFWQAYDNVIPLMLQKNFGLNETLTGIIMALDNVLAVVLLPILGAMSDKVDTHMGKRTPFIIVGTAIAVVTMMMLPISADAGNFVFFVVALGATLLAMSFYRTPAVALMPDVTPKALRSKGNAVINLMGAVGGVLALLFIKFLVSGDEIPSYFHLFLAIAIVMIISVIVLVKTIDENKIKAAMEEEVEETITTSTGKLQPAVMKSLGYLLASIFLWFMAYNAVTTAFSRYATEVWDLAGGGYADCLLIATAGAILSYIPVGIISSKIGRKKCILGGLVLMLGSYFSAGLFTTYSGFINIGFAIIGVGWATVSVNSLPMVVEMASGSDVGKYTGFYYTASMSAQIVTPIVSGILLQNVGYTTLFPYSCVFTLLAIMTMTQVKHGDNKPTMKKSVLENFDIED